LYSWWPESGNGTGFFVGTADGRYSAAELAFVVEAPSIVCVDGSTDVGMVYTSFELCRAWPEDECGIGVCLPSSHVLDELARAWEVIGPNGVVGCAYVTGMLPGEW